jgi:nitroreductase
MSTISIDILLNRLQWRYATKQFDPTQKIPAETWQALEETLVLTPSSFGLQPWAFVVVSDPDIRAKLRVESRNQSQITDSSNFVVFAARTTLDEAYIDRHIGRIAEVRGVERDGLADQRDRLINLLVSGPRSKGVREWATRQAYIALGNFLTTTALLGIDVCPMEGINLPKADELLGLPERGFAAVVAAAAGYRAAEDKNARLAKVRFAADDVIFKI